MNGNLYTKPTNEGNGYRTTTLMSRDEVLDLVMDLLGVELVIDGPGNGKLIPKQQKSLTHGF